MDFKLNKSFHNLFSLARPHKKWLILIGIMILIGSAFEAVGVGSVLPFVELLQNKESALKYNKYLAKFGFEEQSYKNILLIISVGFAGIILIKNIFLILTNFIRSFFKNLMQASLSKELFSGYLSREYNFFVITQQGLLIQRITAMVGQATAALNFLVLIATNLITVAFIYLVMAAVSLKLTLLVTLLILILSAVAGVVSRYRAYASGKEMVRLETSLYSTAAETISGMRVIRAFGAEGYVSRKFNDLQRRLTRLRIINETIFSIPSPLIETILIVGLCSFVIITAQRTENLMGMLPTFSLFAFGLIRIMQKISPLYSYFMEFANYLPSANLVAESIYSVPPIVKNDKNISNPVENIIFRDVTFSYPQDPDKKVLDSVNLTINKQQFVAIVGHSGSGKSTIMDLILGLYKPDHGEILINNVSLGSLNIDDWRGRIGYVSQETFLFNGSVKENIAFATSDIDLNRVEEAAKLANAHEFISRLPNGYDTEVGERGLKLSGGERQRLAIARALYRNPEIIVLDEATSSLDSKAEKEVQKAIENLEGEKTLIVVAHRLSTILKADMIYVIHKGRLIEYGNHQTLLKKQGLYRDLCNRQNIYN
jgi:subfamily B ATP-binding cassette protein MsbA